MTLLGRALTDALLRHFDDHLYLDAYAVGKACHPDRGTGVPTEGIISGEK